MLLFSGSSSNLASSSAASAGGWPVVAHPSLAQGRSSFDGKWLGAEALACALRGIMVIIAFHVLRVVA